ncbi:uncharacterized protein LOC17881219 [Capsella rubella]|nr:uncharacterized protein LOC17881219 [Capsella rubella]
MDTVVRRLQLEHNQTLMLWWYKYYLRTLPLDPHRVITHDCKSLNKHGIMIPFLRNGGYRSFFNLSSLSHMIPRPKQIHIHNIKDFVFKQSPSSVKRNLKSYTTLSNTFTAPINPNYYPLPKRLKLGFVLILLCQTDYTLCVEFLNLHSCVLHVREDPLALLRFCIYLVSVLFLASSTILSFGSKRLKDFDPMLLNLLMLVRNPICVSSVEQSFKSSDAFVARAVYDLLVEDSAKPVFKVESAMVPKDSPKIASFSKFIILLENSWNPYLLFHCIIFVSSCVNFPLLRF